MKIIDLAVTSQQKSEQHTKDYCGGKIMYKNGPIKVEQGIVGLSYEDPLLEASQIKYVVSISFLDQGIAIYFRNLRQNRIVLLTYDEIEEIQINKGKDIIRPLRFSLFSLFSRIGLHHNKAVKYLAPKEIIQEETPVSIIKTKDHYFSFVLDKITPERVSEIYLKTKLKDKLHVQIQSPEIITQK